MFNCFKCKLIPPKNFIPATTFSSEYKNEIWVDACLAKEISKQLRQLPSLAPKIGSET